MTDRSNDRALLHPDESDLARPDEADRAQDRAARDRGTGDDQAEAAAWRRDPERPGLRVRREAAARGFVSDTIASDDRYAIDRHDAEGRRDGLLYGTIDRDGGLRVTRLVVERGANADAVGASLLDTARRDHPDFRVAWRDQPELDPADGYVDLTAPGGDDFWHSRGETGAGDHLQECDALAAGGPIKEAEARIARITGELPPGLADRTAVLAPEDMAARHGADVLGVYTPATGRIEVVDGLAAADTVDTLVHEGLHAVREERGRHRLEPLGLNEALTEHVTGLAAGPAADGKVVAYADGVRTVAALESVVGRPAVLELWRTGDGTDMAARLDVRRGHGAWQRFVDRSADGDWAGALDVLEVDQRSGRDG